MHKLFKKTTVTMAVSSLLALYGCGSVDGPTTPPTIAEHVRDGRQLGDFGDVGWWDVGYFGWRDFG